MGRRSKEEKDREIVIPPGVDAKSIPRIGGANAVSVQGLPASAMVDGMSRKITEQVVTALGPVLEQMFRQCEERAFARAMTAIEPALARLDTLEALIYEPEESDAEGTGGSEEMGGNAG